MPETEAEILRAVQKLDEKLSKALERQTDTLSKRIQSLADQHNSARLEQAQENATFANRDVVHKMGSTITEISLRQGVLTRDVAALQAKGGIAWQRYLAIAAVLSGPASVTLALILRLSFG